VPTTVPLARALSKLGILSRARAREAILSGRVRVDGRIERNPMAAVVPERIHVAIDDVPQRRVPWRTILLHKPKGVVTTRRDPQGRRTVFDVVGAEEARGLVAVGRLDFATSGLLLLTSDTALADRLMDPASAVPRVYLVTVRGQVTDAEAARLVGGIGGLRAHTVTRRKVSSKESHLVVELREGKNREVRRLLAGLGHEVTRLKRVSLGKLELGALAAGRWRSVSREEIASAFPMIRAR